VQSGLESALYALLPNKGSAQANQLFMTRYEAPVNPIPTLTFIEN